MKKILILVLSICLLVSLTACETRENKPEPTATAAPTPTPEPSPAVTEALSEKPVEEPAATEKTGATEAVFTNEYGTSSTQCAHTGCTRPIASSGDTNCCTVHSNTCAKCGRYIDEDATWCMKCLTSAASDGQSSSSKSSSSSSSSSSGKESYYCMGKHNTCPNKTYSPWDFYCSSCDPDGDNKEG